METQNNKEARFMILKLLDYANDPTEHDIGNLEDIATIGITVVTGDEIATVTYKDNTVKTFDSSVTRITAYFDDEYEIYRSGQSDNLIDNPKFINRTNSYWR